MSARFPAPKPPLPRRVRAEPVLSPPEGVRVTHPSFPRRACPVLDTGPEPRGAAGAVATHPNTTSFRRRKAPGPPLRQPRSKGGACPERRRRSEKDEKPAPAELTPAERRIRERLEQHWHEPDPYGAPIDSTHTRPLTTLVTATRLHNLYHFVLTTPLIDRDAIRNPSFRP